MTEALVLAEAPANVPPDHVVDFDLYNPFGGEDDLHAAWMKLRNSTSQPIVWTAHNGGHWIALDPELIISVLSTPDIYSSFNVLVPKDTAGAAYRFLPLSLDPPEHRPYRKILNDNLYGTAIHPLEPKVRALTASLIDGFADNGRCNFVDEFAEQLPLRVFMQLVDLPMEHLPKLKHLADQFTRPDGSMDPQDVAIEFGAYITPILAERRASDRTDMLANIARAEVFGRPITDEESAKLAIQVLVGGLDTVVNLMSFTMQMLAKSPEVQERIAADPSLIPAAVNEALRRLPIVASAREVKMDVDVAGVRLISGDMVVAPTELYALDPAINEQPFHYDLDRRARKHIAFGSGHHTCPGQFLAKMEMKILLEEWFARIPRFELEDGVVHRGGIVGGCEPFFLRWK